MSNPLDAIQARADAATEGPWGLGQGFNADGITPALDKADKTEFMALSLNSNSASLFLVQSSAVIPAVTGDGPKAKANAVFIAHAREDAPKLVAALRAVEALCADPEHHETQGPHNGYVSVDNLHAAIREALR